MSLAKAPAADGLRELSVGRINIVDADGTVRMVLSNHELFPTQFQFGSETASGSMMTARRRSNF